MSSRRALQSSAIGAVAAVDSLLEGDAPEGVWLRPAQTVEGRRPRQFDRAVRRVDARSFAAWSSLEPAAVSELHGSSTSSVVMLASKHPNGRVRAAAVERLPDVELRLPLRHLAVRCLDPVVEVRERATELAEGAIGSAHVRDVVAADTLLLSDQMREAAPGVVAAAERAIRIRTAETVQWLARTSGRSADVLLATERVRTLDLLSVWQGYDPVSRELFRSAVDRSTVHDRRAFVRGRDSSLRCHASIIWLQGVLRWPGIDHVALTTPMRERLERSSLGALARKALEEGDQLWDEPETLIIQSLLWQSETPRRMAQRILAATGFDVAAYYRSIVHASPTALAGLGDVGTPADAQIAATFVDDANPAVRHGAVLGLRLDPARFVGQLLAALDDPDFRVSGAAAHRLKPVLHLVGAEQLADVAASGRTPAARGRAERLLRRHDPR